jgi:Zn-dependent peptidase ImmA (M78 family)
MPYRHPGHAFLAQAGPLRGEVDLEHYGDFLRRSAQLEDHQPPVSLDRIYTCFGIPIPRQAPLQEQQGILVDGDSGLILIKEDDPLVRRRFTEGHELMELLFDAHHQQLEVQLGQGFQAEGRYKERLCDRGAAALLMPREPFQARLQMLSMSLQTGRALAQVYQTSLVATLLRMVQVTGGAHALVMWRLGWATAAARAKGSEPPQLRPGWQAQSEAWTAGRLPREQPATLGSVVAIAPQLNQPLTGTEQVTFALGRRRCHIEALPLRGGRQQCVLALMHLLD